MHFVINIEPIAKSLLGPAFRQQTKRQAADRPRFPFDLHGRDA
jgi:hypothetical protein